ncbi:MAG: citrate/2-methylcitrate synthase [Pseudomonadota bacterium]
MNGPELLEHTVGHLKSRMGAAVIGSHALFRGHDLHAELRDMDWVELYLFGITGRRFTPAQVELLHGILVYTSYPDARIWNNRVAALAGSARSTPALGISAALALSEAGIYGGQPGVKAIDFFLRARRALEQGRNLAGIVAWEKRIYGYGRPTPELGDERLPWLLALANKLGLGAGPHLAIALETEQLLLLKNARLRMNYAAMTAALCADMGFSIAEFHMFRVPLFLAGMPPGYIEARERPEGSLFPVPCRHVCYEGVAKRQWSERR